MQALIGKKLGMTQVFDDQGRHIPVTVIQAGPCSILQSKTTQADGYQSVQLGFEDVKEQRATKARVGHCKKAGVGAKRVLREVRLDEGDQCKPGDSVGVSIFEGVEYVDVIGITKGRGFQGVVKRHRMQGGPMAHGSGFHHTGGAIGNRTWPGRVMKNKRMSGHMGNVKQTTQNLKVIQVRNEDNVLLVRGAVPGPTGGILIVRKSLKRAAKKS